MPGAQFNGPLKAQVHEVEGLRGSLLVLRGSTTLLEVSAGVADVTTGAACELGTRFQIASVSKQFTAGAAMILVEDGALALDVPIAEWLPDCPAVWRGLTLHSLLSHSSGLGHWEDLPGFDINEPGHVSEFLQRFAMVPLRSEPGTRWHYSSPGYLLVARIIEQVTGQPYADFVTERILRPLALNSTAVGAPPPGGAAFGYRAGRRVDVDEFMTMPGAGDIWSTVGDLARFSSALRAGEVVGPAARAQMLAAQIPVAQQRDGEGLLSAESYGYGCFLGTLASHPAWFHPGDNPGYQALLSWLPGLGVTIAVLSNDEGASINGVLRQVLPVVTAE